MKTLIASLILVGAAAAGEIETLKERQRTEVAKALAPVRKRHATEWRELARKFLAAGRIVEAADATNRALSLDVLGRWIRRSKKHHWDLELLEGGAMIAENDAGNWSIEKNTITMRFASGWTNTFPISDNGEIGEGSAINSKGETDGTVRLEPTR